MFLKVGELILHADLQGADDAPVIVLLHSLGTNFHLWDPMIPTLTHDYRILRLDMRGHGLSEIGENPFYISDLAKDVLNVVDSLEINSFIVVGVSIGGLIAQYLADTVPERLLSMVLIDTYLAPASLSFWCDMSEDIRRYGLSHRVDDIFSRWLTPAFSTTPAAIGMKQMLRNTSDKGYAGCAWSLSQITQQEIKNKQVPALVMVGEYDTVATPDVAKKMSIARNGKFILLENAAHIPIFEKTEVILSEILTFLTVDAGEK
ncbi:alpha/beta fold hydrolase [Escherichia coli]|nr:alpha/beta fold hydrolase [Escherichia coli]